MSTLRIMTWNILADLWLDKAYYKNIPNKFLDKTYRYTQNKKVINDINADIILLQEVEYATYVKLKRYYRDKYHVFPLHSNENGLWSHDLAPRKKLEQNGSLIMIKLTFLKHLSAIQTSTLKLSDDGNTAGLIQFTHTATGKKFLIVNVHLDPKRSLRLIQLRKLAARIRPYKGKCKIIIGGDFNSNGIKLKDFHEVSHEADSTYYKQKIIIDHIYVHRCKITDGYTFDADKTKFLEHYGSDHLPIVGTIQYK